jgi:hypothetical protein
MTGCLARLGAPFGMRWIHPDNSAHPIFKYVLLTLLLSMAALVFGLILGGMIS